MATIQAGWLDLAQSPASQAVNGVQDEWWSLMCHAATNQMAGLGGTITGFKARFTVKANVTSCALGVWRLVSGTNYTLFGMSQTLASASLGTDNAVTEYTLTTPIKGVLSSDMLSLIVRPANATAFMQGMDDTETLPIEHLDELAGRMRWHDTNNTGAANPFVVGTAYDHTGGGAAYRLMSIAATYEPKVLIVGDSISEGVGENTSHRRATGTSAVRNGYASFMETACRSLGWNCEIASNETSSNDWSEVNANDLNAAALAKLQTDGTGILMVHCGVNDISGANSWATMQASMETVLAVARSNNCRLIFTGIIPWTGKADNSTGTHAHNTTRDTFNENMENWASQHHDVTFCNINQALGKERITAKSGDTTPTSGNLWDLQSHFEYQDSGTPLGVHLTEEGALVAGGALAGMIKAKEAADAAIDKSNRRGVRHRYNRIINPAQFNLETTY